MRGSAPTTSPDTPQAAAGPAPSTARLRAGRRGGMLAPMRLAIRQMGLIWRILSAVWLGMVVAIVLLCLVPVYTALIGDVQIQDVFVNAGPLSRFVTTQVSIHTLDPTALTSVRDEERFLASQYVQGFSPTSTTYFIGDKVVYAGVNGQPVGTSWHGELRSGLGQPLGYDIAQAGPHIKLFSGRLPVDLPPNQMQETLVTPELGLKVGDTVTIQELGLSGNTTTLRVVGVWFPNDDNDPFWNGRTFKNPPLRDNSPVPPIYPVMMTQAGFSNALAPFAQQTTRLGYSYSYEADFVHFTDPMLLNAHNLAPQLDNLAHYSNAVRSQIPTVTGVQSVNVLSRLPAIVGDIGTQSKLISQPLYIVVAQIVGLALLFVAAMASLLVERQAVLLATLKSRGASSTQLLAAFTAQGLVPAVLAAVAGPFLAVALSLELARVFEPATREVSQTYLITSASPTLATLPALLGAALCVCALVLSTARATRRDVLDVRREEARGAEAPFWRRYYLDLALVVICGAGFLELSLFGGLDVRSVLDQQADPLLLAAPGLLLLAGGLLLLRVFPACAAFTSRIASRGRSATGLLAFSQVARVSGQFGRRTLLLTLAVGLGLFALTFQASLARNVQNRAAYQTGGDVRLEFQSGFQGIPAQVAVANGLGTLPGVRGATGLFRAQATTSDTQGHLNVSLLGIDPHSFASVAYWQGNYAQQPLDTLMRQMRAAEPPASSATTAPLWAIIDSSLASQLSLGAGDKLILTPSDSLSSTIVVVVGAVVDDFPTLYPGPSTGFIVVDAGTLLAQLSSQPTSDNASNPNEYWLRTSGLSSDTRARTAALDALHASQYISSEIDRPLLVSRLSTDPLTSGMTGLLLVGAVLSALLAILGSFVQAVSEARGRLTQFAILRTLGTGRAQLTRMLLLEQGFVYLFGLLGGAALGLLLSTATIPFLAFSDARTSAATAGVPPDTLVLDPRAILLFLAIVLVALVGALLLEAGVAARVGLGTALRVGED